MIRTRMVWFTTGFLLTGASITYFIHRHLSIDRHYLLSQLKHDFGNLESRVSNLESLPHSSSTSQDGSGSN